MAYTVKAVADLAGVSVRTLHYYDDIALLKPTSVSSAGYRLYTEPDLARLQQILFFRELGFGLHEIKEILESPDFDRKQALLMHRQALLERRAQLNQLISSIDRTIDAMERGVPMADKEMFTGFDNSKYEAEVRQRWGYTKEYEESVQRTKGYDKNDWAAISKESAAINTALAALMDRDPADPEVQQWIGKWHRLINDRFYTCSLEVFRGLGDLYVQDERFTATYDNVKPGLAQFMQKAMHAYADLTKHQA